MPNNLYRRRWMSGVLLAAGAYNILWGGFAVLSPLTIFQWAKTPPPNYPEIWQCVGMIVGVYGVGYIIAAGDPLRHWPIVLVGWLGKVFGPIGFLQAAWRGRWPWAFGYTIITNDLIWIVPFALILHHAYKAAKAARTNKKAETALQATTAAALHTNQQKINQPHTGQQVV